MPDGAVLPKAARADALRVGGFVPFTTTDYPDALAAVVFCQGCPWRCGYCHNPHLIAARGDDERDFARILDWLGNAPRAARRRRVLRRRAHGAGRARRGDHGGACAGLQGRAAHRRRVSAAARGGAAARRLGRHRRQGATGRIRRSDRRSRQRDLRAGEPRPRPCVRRRARGAHDRASGADAAARAGSSSRANSPSGALPAGCCSRFARRAARTARSSPVRRTESPSSPRCLRSCVRTCRRSRCVIEVDVRPPASVVFQLRLSA